MTEPVTLASPTFTTNRPIPLAEFAADIERRRREAGEPDVPRNSGARPTPSKRALLAAIEKAGGRW